MIKWILPLLWSSTLYAQGFMNGNEFTAYELRGNLYLTCYGANGQQVTVRKRCEQSQLLPVSQDFFVTEEKINGDRVRLKNVSGKGNEFEKTVYYNSEKQRTHRKISLWARYFGDRGLLNEGENLIEFEFQNKQKDVLKQGQLEVLVENGGGRVCRDGRDYSYDTYDCYYGDARQFCERYFEWNNYCF